MSSPSIPAPILDALARAHPSWQPHLLEGLHAVQRANPVYLEQLAAGPYLPTEQRVFAAFAQPLEAVRYVLVGEGPYPRAESASGVCFMDAAVGSLWCTEGLSKPVNRATSLRNFMKMLLVADGLLEADNTGGNAIAPIAARAAQDGMVQTLGDVQHNLMRHGFLLLNAALVFRPEVKPVVEARAWLPFLRTVLAALAKQQPLPTLILWGKIAEQLQSLPETQGFPQLVSEHPFNFSFIRHAGMQSLFGPMRLLRCAAHD